MRHSFGVYRELSRLPWPKSYLGKFLFSAFVGVHVPLISILGYVVLRSHDWSAALPLLGVGLAATLVGTLATLMVQGRLLAPVLRTSEALDEYVRYKTLPDLPQGFGDEAGILMRNAQECVVHLAELLRLKNDLLAILSHDARSPLTGIIFAGDVSRLTLQDPNPDLGELREMNAIVRESARRQLELMDGMLTLARSDSGVLEVQRRRTDFGELLRGVVRNARLQAEQKGVALELAPGTGSGLKLEVDIQKTEQVIGNLVHNAIKFTPLGGTVVVELRVEEAEVEVCVRDSGIGISEDALMQLFKPFSKAHRGGTDREGGSGLGLWICKTFTELQGGRIGVESVPGEGSRFRVFFPREVAMLPAEVEHAAAEEPEYALR